VELEEVSGFQRSVAGKCSECGEKIGCDEDCYRIKDKIESPQFVGNDSELVCMDCA
jgi:hypothetical protein